MTAMIGGYLTFVVILVSAMYFLPAFFLQDVVAVCLAVMAVNKAISISNLSAAVLGVIVVALTVINPIVTLMWATDGSVSNILSYFFPANLNNLRNLIDLVSPTCALIVLVKFLRSP